MNEVSLDARYDEALLVFSIETLSKLSAVKLRRIMDHDPESYIRCIFFFGELRLTRIREPAPPYPAVSPEKLGELRVTEPLWWSVDRGAAERAQNRRVQGTALAP